MSDDSTTHAITEEGGINSGRTVGSVLRTLLILISKILAMVKIWISSAFGQEERLKRKAVPDIQKLA